MNGLEDQTRRANETAGALRDQRDYLQARIDRVDALAATAVPSLVAGRLEGERFVILADRNTGVTDDVRSALEDSGAVLVASLALTDRVQDEAAQQELADILGLPTDTDASAVQDELVRQLAERLSGVDAGGEDLLLQLLDAGFLEAGRGSGLNRVDGHLSGVGRPGQLLAVVQADRESTSQEFLGSVFLEFSNAGGAASAAESSFAQDGLVNFIRRSAAPGKWVTVDNADESIGQISLAVGLQRLLESGQGGDFGFKPGADSLMPPLES